MTWAGGLPPAGRYTPVNVVNEAEVGMSRCLFDVVVGAGPAGRGREPV